MELHGRYDIWIIADEQKVLYNKKNGGDLVNLLTKLILYTTTGL